MAMKFIFLSLAMLAITGCSSNKIPEIIRDGNIVCVKEEVLKLFHDGKFFVKGESYQCIDVLFQTSHDDIPTMTYEFSTPKVGTSIKPLSNYWVVGDEHLLNETNATCESCSGCTPYNHPNPNCRAIGYHNPNSECKGNYNFYTQPDEHCKKVLADEYKAMANKYLEKKRTP